MLSEQSTQRLISFSCEPSIPPRHRYIHAWFEHCAAANPDHVAVVDADRKITYRALSVASSELAERLVQAGVIVGDNVAVHLERCAEVPLSILAIFKAGGTVVCLDVTDPPDRIQAILNNAECRVVVAESDAAALFNNQEAIPPGSLLADAARGLVQPAPPGGDRNHESAFVFYTTGSTGEPKGVVIAHYNRCERLTWELDAYGISATERVIFKTPISFARIVKEVFWPLLSGGTLIIAPPGSERDMAALTRLITREQVTFAIMVPTQLCMFMHEPDVVRCMSLRVILSEGENLPTDVYEYFSRAVKNVEVFNAYGLTEISTVAAWRGGVLNGLQNVPAGRPAGLELLILDSASKLADVGETGEIFVRTKGVMAGYHNRPDLTNERFKYLSVIDVSGEAYFRTGDLGYWLPNGELVYVGRKDRAVKVRGFRIEPGAIEFALRQQNKINEAAVLIREEPSGDKRIIAFVTCEAEELDTKHIREVLAKTLPSYAIPHRFLRLPRLPLTPNGKLDRKALSRLDVAEPPTLHADVSTRARLLGIWESVLGVSSIFDTSDFFELGGDSLLALRTVLRCESEFGIKFSHTALLEAPTFAQFVDFVERGESEAAFSRFETFGASLNTPRPLFCVHGVYGGVMGFKHLADRLPRDTPLFAIESSADRTDSIRQTAGIYLDEIQSIQKTGPYLIAGYSFGGIIAFELACLLEERGETVQKLALLDSTSAVMHTAVPPFIGTAYVRIKRDGDSALYGLDCRYPGGGEARGTKWLLSKRSAYAAGDSWQSERNSQLALLQYKATSRFTGDACLFVSGTNEWQLSIEQELGWGRLCARGIQVHRVPGNHITMLSPPWVDTLASRLGSYLAKT